MASPGGIAFLVTIMIYLIIDLILDNLFGDRGKSGQIEKHYFKIHGKPKTFIQEEMLSVNEELDKARKRSHKSTAIIVAVVIGILSYILFFNAILVSVSLALFAIYVVPRVLLKKEQKKREKIINLQFRDALNSIISSLKSGQSMNGAILRVPLELTKTHAIYKDKLILREFIAMKEELTIGVPLDDALINFRERMNCEEADDFVNSVIILKKKGGNLVEVMENTITMISDKMALKAEIEVITAAKKGEAKVLTALPVVMVVGMALFMRSFISPLFEGLATILPIIAFLFLIINYFVGEKITDIEA